MNKMILTLLAVLALTSGAAAVPSDPPMVQYDPAPASVLKAAKESGVEDVVHKAVAGFGLNLVVQWRRCGVENALYFPDSDYIVMCYELLGGGAGFARFTVAHELGHAVIDQLDLPYTGSQESAADEFAVAVSIVLGNGGDPDAAATRYQGIKVDPPPSDEHAPFAHRAGQIWREAHVDRDDVVRRWSRLTKINWRVIP